MLLLLERDGRILSANRAPFGFALEEAIGRNVFDYAPRDLRPELRESLDAIFGGEASHVREIPSELPDGSVRWFATHTGLVRECGNAIAATVIVRDITAQKTAEAPLRNSEERYRALVEQDARLTEAYRQLQALETRRDALVHMLVHDLRSPLTSLHFLLAIASEDAMEADPADVVATLKDATRKTAELSEMVGDVLDVSRFEGGIMPLDIEENDLGEIAREAVAHVPPRESVWVSLKTAGELSIPCDRSVIRRVITNLVSNAVKASPQGSAVSVEVINSASYCLVSVQDEGDGIAQEVQDRIFDKFWRGLSDQQFDQVRGSGLGLTFCKLAVIAHNGEIGLRSQVGRGSNFFFSLPNKTRAPLLR